MATTPIVISDYISPVENTRSQLITEEREKIKGKHGFIFNSFKTERQRLQEYLKNREIERNTSIINNFNLEMLKTEEANLVKNPIKQPSFLQPSMRFKPRTDLERIYDEIEKNRVGIMDRSILKKQLSKLELNKAKRKEKEKEDDGESLDENNPFYTGPLRKKNNKKDQTKELLNEINDPLFLDKDMDKEIFEKDFMTTTNFHTTTTNITTKNQTNSTTKYLKRKQVDNSKAKELLKELYYKTHFKGAINLALFSKFTQ